MHCKICILHWFSARVLDYYSLPKSIFPSNPSCLVLWISCAWHYSLLSCPVYSHIYEIFISRLAYIWISLILGRQVIGWGFIILVVDLSECGTLAVVISSHLDLSAKIAYISKHSYCVSNSKCSKKTGFYLLDPEALRNSKFENYSLLSVKMW